MVGRRDRRRHRVGRQVPTHRRRGGVTALHDITPFEVAGPGHSEYLGHRSGGISGSGCHLVVPKEVEGAFVTLRVGVLARGEASVG